MDIPPELVTEILQRLPWTSRRRLRLVCRSWRDLVHQRTTEMQQRRDAVPLIVTTESAYVVDDLAELEERRSSDVTCIPRELHLGGGDSRHYENMEVVGVCNGFLCLCDEATPGGAITLANPATGDVLRLPPMPRHGLFRRHNTRRSDRSWHQAYSFGYHNGTGQYKVVHVPCFFKSKDTIQVFTLGEAAWREVPTPGYAKCKLDAGIISVNGATYWVTEGSDDRIMSFDLESERVTCMPPLPMPARPISHLSQVNRRLGTTITGSSGSLNGSVGIQVWVLEGRRMEQEWIYLYRLSCGWTIARPYFIHGDYDLIDRGDRLVFYQHKPVKYYYGGMKSNGVVHDVYCDRTAEVFDIKGQICRTFAYIKTEEALSVHRRW